MKPAPSSQDYLGILLEGLRQRNINFVVSQDALGCRLSEVFIIEVNELILFPEGILDQNAIRFILEIRTPLKARLTIFTNDVSEYKLAVMQAVSDLKQYGINIPNMEHVISVQELSIQNIRRLMESLENWYNSMTKGRPRPRQQQERNNPTSSALSREPKASLSPIREAISPDTALCSISQGSYEINQDLEIDLRNSIKTYWTERYLARFLNVSLEKAKEVAIRIGIQREICGQEVLYFFKRKKALCTYFVHVLKGILEELGLHYEETVNHIFYLPDFQLVILYFDGEKERLRVLAEDYAKTNDLIFVVPEHLRITIGEIQYDHVQIIPLAREHIYNTLRIICKRSQVAASLLL